jgi:hypothetical protein
MDISRRSILKGFGAMGLTALFRPKLNPSLLVEIGEDDILEEYYANPSAVDMVISPQMPFRPERIVVPMAVAPKWIVEDIHIGHQTQLDNLDNLGIPSRVFAADNVSPDLVMDTIMPGMEFRMRVRRSGLVKVGCEPEIFQAVIIGRAEGRRGMMLPISSDPYPIIG